MALFDRFRGKKKNNENSEEVENNIIEEAEKVTADEPMPEEPVEIQEVEKKKERPGLFAKFKQSLSKTRDSFNEKITTLVKSSKKLDEDFWEELEEILIESDVGVNTSVELVSRVRESARKKKIKDSSEVMALIKDEVKKLLESQDVPLNINHEGLTVVLVVGVNGAGKTTSIAKIAHVSRMKTKGNPGGSGYFQGSSY